MSIKQYKTQGGFKAEEAKEGDYVFGLYSNVPKIILREDRDWFNVIPVPELQSPKFETYSCVSHTTINAIETIEKFKGYETDNYSERFLASASGTKEGGNTPQNVAEYVRKVGMVTEELYPTEDAVSWEDYYKTITPKMFEYARRWLDERTFMHEYVPSTPEAIYDALGMSPLGVSVVGWFQDGEYFVKPDGMRDNHFTLCVGAKKGEYWIIFDSYAPFVKKVPWNTKFEVVKRFYVAEKTTEKQNWLQALCTRLCK